MQNGMEKRKEERLGSIFEAVQDGKRFLVEEASLINPLSEVDAIKEKTGEV
jgi:predicted homoserine dehydrogenase-like protein